MGAGSTRSRAVIACCVVRCADSLSGPNPAFDDAWRPTSSAVVAAVEAAGSVGAALRTCGVPDSAHAVDLR